MNEKRWHIRKSVDEDYANASHLRKLFFNGVAPEGKRSCEEDYYRWKIQNNPVQTGLFHVADDKGLIVGMTTATPKHLIIKQKLKKGAEICDAFVHPNYQGQGIFPALVNALREKALEDELEFIYATPIDNSNSLYSFEKKCNFLKIPSANVYNLVRPFNITKIIQKKLRLSFIPAFVFSIIDPLAALMYEIFYPVKSSHKAENGLHFSLVPCFTEDTYKLCKKVSANYDCIVERSRQYLDWRFIKNPDNYSIWLAQDNRETLGYMVLKLGTWQGLKVGYIVDFLTDEGRPDVFTRLILHALFLFHKDKVDMVSVWVVKDSFYYNILKPFGFRQYKKVCPVCYSNAIGQQVIGHQLKWHFTMADSDNI